MDDLLAARFPAIARDAGGYESYFLKAAHPSEPKAVWIRHTVHKRPGAEATGSLWCTLFDREAGPPAGVKQTLAQPHAGASELLRIGRSCFARGEASADFEVDGREAGWGPSLRELRGAAAPPAARLDVLVGPLSLPWVANGALSLRGERHALGGPGRLRPTKVDEAPTRCRFELAGTRVRIARSQTSSSR